MMLDLTKVKGSRPWKHACTLAELKAEYDKVDALIKADM